MDILKRLAEDLKTAMKSHDQIASGVIRMLTAAIRNKEIEKRGAGKGDSLTGDEAIAVIAAEAKKRRDSIAVFSSGGREDLAKNEQSELEIILKYLPAQMTAAEAESAVKEILGRIKAKNVGEAMKAVMAELRGRVDGAVVGEVVKRFFA